MISPNEVYVLAAHENADEELIYKLRTQLEPVLKQRNACLFDDTMIKAGEPIDEVRRRHIQTATVLLLGLSSDLMTQSADLIDLALQQRGRGTRVLPLIMRQCPYKHIPALSQLQVLPRSNRALSEAINLDAALCELVDEIAKVLNETKVPSGSCRITQHEDSTLSSPSGEDIGNRDIAKGTVYAGRGNIEADFGRFQRKQSEDLPRNTIPKNPEMKDYPGASPGANWHATRIGYPTVYHSSLDELLSDDDLCDMLGFPTERLEDAGAFIARARSAISTPVPAKYSKHRREFTVVVICWLLVESAMWLSPDNPYASKVEEEDLQRAV